MSGKRSAGSDLNHDNWDQEEEPEEAGTFAQASQDQLKGRVIKKAKRRVNTNADGAAPSIFAGFGGFGSGSNNLGAAKSGPTNATGMFDFLQKPPSSTATTPASAVVFGGAAAAASPLSSTTTTGNIFGGAISPSNGESKPALGSFNFGGLPQKTNGAVSKWTCDSCMVANDSDKDACVCCETRRPGSVPKAEKVETKPPAAATKWTCDTCMVPNEASKDACVCCDTARPGAVPKKAATTFGSAAAAASSAFAIQPGGGFQVRTDEQ